MNLSILLLLFLTFPLNEAIPFELINLNITFRAALKNAIKEHKSHPYPDSTNLIEFAKLAEKLGKNLQNAFSGSEMELKLGEELEALEKAAKDVPGIHWPTENEIEQLKEAKQQQNAVEKGTSFFGQQYDAEKPSRVGGPIRQNSKRRRIKAKKPFLQKVNEYIANLLAIYNRNSNKPAIVRPFKPFNSPENLMQQNDPTI